MTIILSVYGGNYLLNIEAEIYACIATLNEIEESFKKGLVDFVTYKRQSEAMLIEIRRNLEQYARMNFNFSDFVRRNNLISRFPLAAIKLGLNTQQVSVQKAIESSKSEFYDRLGIEILKIARKEQSKGIILLADLIVAVESVLPPNSGVTVMDMIKTINHLAKEGLIPGIRTLKSGVKVVELVPLELSEDQGLVLSIASSKGWTSVEEVMVRTRWPQDYAMRVLESLVQSGLAKADRSHYSSGIRYYFPGLRGNLHGFPTRSHAY